VRAWSGALQLRPIRADDIRAPWRYQVSNCRFPVNAFRALAVRLSSAVLALLLVEAVFRQLAELQGATELFPVASFVVLLSLASFSISWARMVPPRATEQELKVVKRSALDLLIAATLTLVAAGLLQVSADPLLKTTPLLLPIVLLHVVFMASGLFLGWVAVVRLLGQALSARVQPGDPSGD